ncbi:carnitine O-palmitoyltransferase 1, liver isoform-like [Panonychus citri]|uniref:carnitine O-palmitoyltransferase 1, liver isoform-like n=1 Tax=Panonychus citri TaxID=50023 RepID=UPI00230822A2|nr:carnitine O-palmitoyltransferase 1, liver isoform-like [Panonychus citri]
MAEAHQAVAFSFQITHEGVHINYDTEILNIVWTSGVRSYRKRFTRSLNNIKNGVFPSSLEFLAAILVLVTACHSLLQIDPSFGFINFASSHFPITSLVTVLNLPDNGRSLLACFVYGVAVWVAKAMIMKYTLKCLLIYKGWMYESHGSGPSLSSSIWVFLMKMLTIKRPLLYSYQGALPRLPLPSVGETIDRYLRSIQALCDDDEDYQRKTKLAYEFRDGIARKLQKYLIFKSWWASNYVSDWWEEYVYLRSRSPLMINSNFYGIDTLFETPTSSQTSRAANLVYSCLIFRRLIDRQELKPIMLQGLVPLCSWQYERLFNTTRLPGIETDKLVHYSDSQHIVVLSKGKYYKVNIYFKGRLLLPREIESILDKIVADDSPALRGEEHLSVVTAVDRVSWSQTRDKFFSRGINKSSLDAIEKSAFVLILDDVDFEFDEKDPTKLDSYGQTLLHGRGYDRWYDKSFDLIVGRNGRAGFNAEHSWADAPIMAHLWEFILAYDHANLGYDESGRCKVGNGFQPPAGTRLKWEFPLELCQTIDKYVITAQKLVVDVDLKLIMFQEYGKGFMKKNRVSPDAYIQMALQLAYFRDSGKFSLTYEASMTRLFREGRTETVRPVTIESAAWVRSMNDQTKTKEDRIALLKHACQRHQIGYQNAMCGKGIDRHLFCLYVISKYLEIDSPFLKEVLSEPWKLSTSQTPHGQAGLLDLKKYPNHISAGGGFGPVADDGYGVSYIIAGEDKIFFHISSKESSTATDSLRFAKNIMQSLRDMRELLTR